MKVVVRHFSELRLEELYHLLKLRQEVFVLEQNCLYQDLDDRDQKSFHALLGKSDLIGTLRLMPPGVRFEEWAIGRLAVVASQRGRGYARMLMHEALQWVEGQHGARAIRLSAQSYLADFYQSFGLETVRGPYDEDGIPHLEMLRKRDS